MIWWTLLLFLLGLALSAFFSGSETGFYRIPHVRMLIDALGGDWRARALLWLTHRPSLFVATTLVGNNIANYCCALAIVIAVNLVLGDSPTVEVLAPIVFAPVLFVYGELLPKSLFYYMPSSLLRRCGPLFVVFTVLFFPVSSLLWALSRLLAIVVGESPQRLLRRLARAELNRVLEEGHEVGILRPSQRALAQGIFADANRPITEFAFPLSHWEWTREGVSREEALEVASRYQQDVLPVEAADNPGNLIGYVRVPELYLNESSANVIVHPWLDVADTATHLAGLMQMQSAQEIVARLTNAGGETVGFVTVDQLCESLFQRGDKKADEPTQK